MATKLTAAKKAQFEAELEDLKVNGRQHATQQIQIARGFGDLSENAEYDIARAEQAKLEARIAELEAILSDCELIEETGATDTVDIGRTVTITDLGKKSVRTLTIVGVYESDPFNNKVSNESPIGKALLGKKKGEIAIFEHKNNKIRYRIDSIR